jgi:hypothetical protein
MTIKSWNDIPVFFFRNASVYWIIARSIFVFKPFFRTILSLMPKPGLLFHPDFQ